MASAFRKAKENEIGKTPLHRAAESKSKTGRNHRFVESRSQPKRKGKRAWLNPSALGGQTNENPDCIDALVEAGADTGGKKQGL